MVHEFQLMRIISPGRVSTMVMRPSPTFLLARPAADGTGSDGRTSECVLAFRIQFRPRRPGLPIVKIIHAAFKHPLAAGRPMVVERVTRKSDGRVGQR